MPRTKTLLFSFLVALAAASSLSSRQFPGSAPPCPLPVWKVSDLQWHNSTHHLDCDARSLRANHTRPNLATAALCMTGLNAEPAGYGPPEIFTVNITGIGPCKQRNPGSVPPRKIGNGWIRCGSSAPVLHFQGNSNLNSSRGHFRVTQQYPCPAGVGEDDDGKIKMYTLNGEAEFGLKCEHDSDFNATCTSDPPTFVIPVTGWKEGYARMIID